MLVQLGYNLILYCCFSLFFNAVFVFSWKCHENYSVLHACCMYMGFCDVSKKKSVWGFVFVDTHALFDTSSQKAMYHSNVMSCLVERIYDGISTYLIKNCK